MADVPAAYARVTTTKKDPRTGSHDGLNAVVAQRATRERLTKGLVPMSAVCQCESWQGRFARLTRSRGIKLSGHDPYDLIGTLRDHLSAHDAPLSFLMGAGTSSAVNIAPAPAAGAARGYEALIPAICELTKMVRTACVRADSRFEAAWDGLVTACEARKRDPNIEELLGLLRLTTAAMTPTDTAFALQAADLDKLEKTIQMSIAKIAAPDESVIPVAVPHHLFAGWVRNASRGHPVEVFTTNYDVLIERSLELARVPVFDGFVGSYRPYFLPSAVGSPDTAAWTRVWKIHGSVNWPRRRLAPCAETAHRTGR